MLNNDFSFEEYNKELKEYDELMNSLFLKNKTFLLSDMDKANISDLIDLVNKFSEIKTIFMHIDFDKLTSNDILLLIDQLKVLQKIIAIIIEDPSYNGSSDVISRFQCLLVGIIIKTQYVESLKRKASIDRFDMYEWNTMVAFGIDHNNFFQLMQFVKSTFLFTDMGQIDVQNDLDRWFSDVFMFLAYIYKKLSFNAIYTNNQPVLNKFIQIVEYNPSYVRSIQVLHDNALFKDRIPRIVEGLEKLYNKIAKSNKEMKLGSWSFGDFGVKDLNEILSEF